MSVKGVYLFFISKRYNFNPSIFFMRKIFKNQESQTLFEKQGFVIIDLDNTVILNEIDESYRALTPDDQFYPKDNRYHCTFIDTNVEYKRKAFDVFNRCFTPFINQHLIDFELMAGNFYVKPKGCKEFEIHQNWSVVDESKHTTVTLWIPMQDTDEQNGTIEVVPGSHKLSLNVTCFGSPYYFEPFINELKQSYFLPIPLKRGQILVFDDNLIHYSKMNQTENPRRAIQLIASPKEAPLIIYFPDPQDAAYFNVYETNKEFYLKHDMRDFIGFNPPLPKINRVPNQNKLWTEAEFNMAMKMGNEMRHKLYAQNDLKTTDLYPSYLNQLYQKPSAKKNLVKTIKKYITRALS